MSKNRIIFFFPREMKPAATVLIDNICYICKLVKQIVSYWYYGQKGLKWTIQTIGSRTFRTVGTLGGAQQKCVPILKPVVSPSSSPNVGHHWSIKWLGTHWQKCFSHSFNPSIKIVNILSKNNQLMARKECVHKIFTLK